MINASYPGSLSDLLHVDGAIAESGVNSSSECADFGVSVHHLIIQDSYELASVGLEQFAPHSLKGLSGLLPFIIWAQRGRNVPLPSGLKLAVLSNGHYCRYRFSLVLQDEGPLSQIRFFQGERIRSLGLFEAHCLGHAHHLQLEYKPGIGICQEGLLRPLLKHANLNARSTMQPAWPASHLGKRKDPDLFLLDRQIRCELW
jgi:hypothetical protein